MTRAVLESPRKRTRLTGLSLIELAVVLAILGALAAIVVPSVAGFFGASQSQQERADQRALQVAVDSFRTDGKNIGSSYPTLANFSGGTGTPPAVEDADGTNDCESGNGIGAPGEGCNSFINIAALVSGVTISGGAIPAGFLTGADAVKSADTSKNTTATNSPSGLVGWYVDAKGKVQAGKGGPPPPPPPPPPPEPGPPPAGTFLLKWGSVGTGDGQFNLPVGLEADGSGNVYVADKDNNRVQKFTTTGQFVTKWSTTATVGVHPGDVAIDPSGNVYALNGWDCYSVGRYTPTGLLLTSWGSNCFNPNLANGEFHTPQGIATDSSGNVYVADTGNNRVQRFGPPGNFLAKWGSGPGSANGQFNGPYGIAVDGAGNVYVADSNNNRIQRFSPTGTFITAWGAAGSGDGQFNFPYGVATDSAGNVYVADVGNHRIQKFDPNGTFLTKWGSGPGIGDGQFNRPGGISVDSTGNVYVADTLNNRIQKFASGEVTPPPTLPPPPPPPPTGLTLVATIAVPAPPRLMAVNSVTHRAYVAVGSFPDSSTYFVSVIDGPANTANIPVPDFSSGPLYVATNDATNRVYVNHTGANFAQAINGSTNTVIGNITTGAYPEGIGTNLLTDRLYIANTNSGNVSVINTAADVNTVVTTIAIPGAGAGVTNLYLAVVPATNRVFVTAPGLGKVFVIDGATNTVVQTVQLSGAPRLIAANPVTNRLYIALDGTPGQVLVMDGTNGSVLATIPIGSNAAQDVAVSPALNRVYVTSSGSSTLTVIDGATNTVATTVVLPATAVRVAADASNGSVYVGAATSQVWVVLDAPSEPGF